MILFTFGSTLFALPLSWAGAMYPWASERTIIPFVIGAIILIGFGLYERRPVEPVFPYRIFGNRVLRLSLFMSFLHGTIFYTCILYVPLFLQAVFLEGPFKSAVSILPLASSVVVFTVCGAVAVEIIRKYKWAIVLSWALTISGIGLWALWRHDSSQGLKNGLQIIAGVGLGALFSILFIPMQAAVQHVDDTGLAVGILTSFRIFGGLVGIAIGSTIFNNIFEKNITLIAQLPPELAMLKDAREAIAYIPALALPQLDREVIGLIIEAYRKAITAVFYFLVGTGGAGFLISFLMVDLSLEKEEVGRQGLQGRE